MEAKASDYRFTAGGKISGCRACDRVFSTVANFDRHRKGGECHIDGTGLVLNARGLWAMPGGDFKRGES